MKSFEKRGFSVTSIEEIRERQSSVHFLRVAVIIAMVLAVAFAVAASAGGFSSALPQGRQAATLSEPSPVAGEHAEPDSEPQSPSSERTGSDENERSSTDSPEDADVFPTESADHSHAPSGPSLATANAVAGVLESEYGTFDVILFRDGSYFFDGVEHGSGARVVDAYDVSTAVALTYVAAIENEPEFAFWREGVPPSGEFGHHGFTMNELGLRWVTEGLAPANITRSVPSGITVSVEPSSVPGIPASLELRTPTDGSGPGNSALAQKRTFGELAAYRGQSVNSLMESVDMPSNAETVQWGFERSPREDWSRLGYKNLAREFAPVGFRLESVFLGTGNTDPVAVLTLRRGFETVTVTELTSGSVAAVLPDVDGGGTPSTTVLASAGGQKHGLARGHNEAIYAHSRGSGRAWVAEGNVAPQDLVDVLGAVESLADGAK